MSSLYTLESLSFQSQSSVIEYRRHLLFDCCSISLFPCPALALTATPITLSTPQPPQYLPNCIERPTPFERAENIHCSARQRSVTYGINDGDIWREATISLILSTTKPHNGWMDAYTSTIWHFQNQRHGTMEVQGFHRRSNPDEEHHMEVKGWVTSTFSCSPTHTHNTPNYPKDAGLPGCWPKRGVLTELPWSSDLKRSALFKQAIHTTLGGAYDGHKPDNCEWKGACMAVLYELWMCNIYQIFLCGVRGKCIVGNVLTIVSMIFIALRNVSGISNVKSILPLEL